ncbi:ATP-binding protein [[Clostridium] innocuum]|nr:ATP-binding protein [[Clostridium] innocuum]
MFIGRKQELNKLNDMYNSNTFEFAVIYGRRRVGKSTLINEFCKGKKSIYYMAVESDLNSNIRGLSNAVMKYYLPELSASFFSSIDSILDFIDTKVNEKIILAIDEYPYMAETYPAFSSLLQKHIDEKWKHSKLMLILCGSSMSFMENQVLGYRSPLYGRRTAQFKIQPFRYVEIKQFHWPYTNEELAQIYGITGGIGEYLHAIDPKKSVEENIISLFMTPSGRMFEEPLNLLKQELRDPKMYHAILDAIASGCSSLNEIAQRAGEDTSACSYHLKSLMSLGIVNKKIPIGVKETSRKTVYTIADTSFIFWYRFVYPSVSMIMQYNGDLIYQKFVKNNINDFMGTVFERMCQEYMQDRRTLKEAPFLYQNIGRWWGSNPSKKREEEIDLCAMNQDALLIGECKWTTKQVTIKVLHDLQERGKLFQQKHKFYYLFSKNGFHEDVMNYATAHEEVRLVALDDFYKD